MRRLFLFFLLAICSWAQGVSNPTTIYVITDPSGTCSPSYITVNRTTGVQNGCINPGSGFVWTPITTGSSGGITGTGTITNLAVWSSTSALGPSVITDTGTAVSIPVPTTLGTAATQSAVTLYDNTGTATTPSAGQFMGCVTVSTNACTLAWTTTMSLAAGAMTLGVNGSSGGSVVLKGSTSGSMTVAVNPAASSLLVGSNLNYVDGNGNLQLGTDGSVGGSIFLSNSAAAFHNTLSAGATATNSIKFFATVPAANDMFYCVVSSTLCTLTDSGFTVSQVVTTAPSSSINLAGQTGAIATSTALFTPASSGYYRVCYYAKVTRAATSSSILGGTVGFQVLYTDPTDSVAQTVTLPGTSQAGNTITIGTGNVGNSTTTSTMGCGVYQMSTVAVTYGFGYTSVGGTTMQYVLRARVEGPL